MKKYLLVIIIFTFFSNNYKAQCFSNLYFTNYYAAHSNYYEKDTTNLWQLGTSDKTFLNASPISIMTDTINNYPINANSSFIVYGINNPGWPIIITGNYKINTDTLSDYWTLHVSPDLGNTWHNLADLSFCSTFNIMPSLLVQSGNSIVSGYSFNFGVGTTYFQAFNVQNCDTVLFKFGFISDSIENNKEGVQIWNLNVTSVHASVQENSNELFFNIYPNPPSNQLNIEFEQNNSENTQIEIQNLLGQIVYSEILKTNIGKQTKTLDISSLNNGVYFILFKNKTNTSTAKFVKQQFY